MRLKKESVLMVDPPSGWRYGFPKPCPDNRVEDMTTWLIENGYPQEEIDNGGLLYIRYWRKDA